MPATENGKLKIALLLMWQSFDQLEGHNFARAIVNAGALRTCSGPLGPGLESVPNGQVCRLLGSLGRLAIFPRKLKRANDTVRTVLKESCSQCRWR